MRALMMLGLAAMLGACTAEHPGGPQGPGSLPEDGTLSIRFVPEGAASLHEVADVVAEAAVAGVAERHRLWVDFLAPGGTAFQRDGVEVDAQAPQVVRASMAVGGTDAVRFPGTWTAVLGGPDGPLASASFVLQEGP